MGVFAAAVPGVWGSAIVCRSFVTRVVRTRPVGRSAYRATTGEVLDVGNRLWRGPAPAPVDYEALSDAGVTLVVDMRAEADPQKTRHHTDLHNMTLLVLPVANTTAPCSQHFDRFVEHHRKNGGITYLHCEAGEGRTGAMIGAFQVNEGRPVSKSIADALAVGSLTISQLVFIATRGRFTPALRLIELGIDRPTEALFRLAYRGVER